MQKLKFELTKDSEELKKFETMFIKFFEEESKQKVEGVINNIDVTYYSFGDVNITINTIKEDKLKLLEIKK